MNECEEGNGSEFGRRRAESPLKDGIDPETPRKYPSGDAAQSGVSEVLQNLL